MNTSDIVTGGYKYFYHVEKNMMTFSIQNFLMNLEKEFYNFKKFNYIKLKCLYFKVFNLNKIIQIYLILIVLFE